MLLLAVTAVAIAGGGLTWWLLSIAVSGPGASVQIDAIRTGLTAAVGTGGAFALLLAFRRQRSSEIGAVHTIADANERRITELYSKAADQLGSDKAPVRLAGLYALERLAQDNRGQRQTIVNVICAYLQMPYTPPRAAPVEPSADDGSSVEGAAAEDGSRADQERERYEKRLQEHEKRAHEQRVRATAQRILHRHIIAAADETFRWTASIDLSEADLTEAFFSGADLTGADLWRANLTEAFLREANLTQADLREANLTQADLRRATLTGAKLGGVSWTEGTVWPENLRDTIKTASEDVAGGYLRIRDGYQVPQSPTTGPAPPAA